MYGVGCGGLLGAAGAACVQGDTVPPFPNQTAEIDAPEPCPVEDDLRSRRGCATLKEEMGTSAPVPPGDGEVSEDDDLDDLEMTSVMDGAQARELRRVARIAGETERETARPPPSAPLAMETEVSIPKAPAVPVEALATPLPVLAAQASSEGERQGAEGSLTWVVLAFVLLAAAVAFALR